MTLIHGIFFGIGMLIFAYLLFSNAGGVSQVVGASTTGISNVSKTLQGR